MEIATTPPNKELTMKSTEMFETKDCARCGGCGNYSWNSMTGSRCFRCGGSGVEFTKRGAEARAAWIAAWTKQVPARTLQPGDKVVVLDGMRRNKRTVLTIESSAPDSLNEGRWMLRFAPGGSLGGYGLLSGDDMVELPVTAEEKRDALRSILDHPGVSDAARQHEILEAA